MSSKLHILRYPDPRLKVRAQVIPDVDTSVRTLAERMFDLMYEAKGIGLAATQVGMPVRLFVLDLGPEGFGPEVVLNPSVVEMAGEIVSEEGCLSFPEVYVPVIRASRIVVTGRDIAGRELRIAAEGLRARALQHEIDHIDGIVLLDRTDAVGRDLVSDKVKLLEKEFQKKHGKARSR